MRRTLQLLTFTSLYPSSARPRHGIFIESRLQRLLKMGGLHANVVAPVPWFPFKGSRWGEYGRIARTPATEARGGVDVWYPRYPSLPYLGFDRKPDLMASAGIRVVESLLRDGGSIDLVEGHYLYPDGVAAAEIARRISRPYLLAARGSDVNVVAQMPGPRRRILQAVEGSAGVIAVSEALKVSLVRLGIAPERVTVLRNGVDATLFRPEDRRAARIELGLPPDNAPLVICVGNLVEEKQPAIALEAALSIEGLHIAFVGRGPERPKLQRLANERAGQGRVWFLEEMPQVRLRLAYSAADALVLSSAREGWPNVLLEAAACGTPSVAFPVGGVPEILGDLDLGLMAAGPPDAASLSGAIRRLIADPPARAAVQAAAARFAWEPVLEAQMALYRLAANVDGSAVAATTRLEPA